MVFLTVTETWFLYIGIIVASIILLALIFYFTFGFRFKREKRIEHVKIDEVFINELISGLGNSLNIECVDIDNGRLKFKIKDLDALNAELLKKLSTSGVFITGNNVKLLFKYDSDAILKELKQRGIN